MHQDNNHQQPRYFHRSRKPDMKEPFPRKTVNTPKFETGSRTDCDQYTLNKPLKCQEKCDSIDKSFNHKDELDLHMMFYHTVGPSNTQ